MPRPEKVQAVAEIKERIEAARAVFVAEYAGLSVKEQQELRRGLRASESEFKVVKMTLARRAVEELGYDGLSELLIGPTGLAFCADDAAATAKVLRDFAGQHAALVVKGALLSGEVLPPERVSVLADLEPRDVLLGRIAGAFQAPLTQMAGLLAALPRDLASMMQQLLEQKGAEDTGAAEAPRDEVPGADEDAEAASDETDDAPAAGDESPAPEATTEEPAPDSETADSEESADSGESAEAEGDEPAEQAEEED